jgi:polar amino acid transport system substrate-binding protein
MMKFLLLSLFIFSFSAHAAKTKLRWGGDIESGAPFAYTSPDNEDKLIGFEAEIVELIAADLDMEVQFVQNSWDGLIEGLNRGDYDIVVNGVEITPDRAEVVNFSQPYYYTSEILAVRKNTNDISTLLDLANRKVGTLDASLAQRILNDQKFPISVIGYDEEMHAYSDLALGRTEAVLLDEPIALYYAKPNTELKLVGGPIGYMEYGIVTRKNDQEFNHRISASLKKLIDSGKVQEILERWGMWNDMTAKAWGKDPAPKTKPIMYFKFLENAQGKKTWNERIQKYIEFLPKLLKGAIMTLEISIISMALAMFLGLLTALARLYGNAPVRWLALTYVEIFRGTPLLIQLYLIFYGLPHVGISLEPMVAAILGLGLNYGACEAENYRAGILSIPRTQMDASQALGMNWYQSLRHIILPQAIRVVIPPVTNDFIALLKDSSLVSVISMVELTTIYGQLASTHFDYLGLGILTAMVYFVIGLPFVKLSRYFEKRITTASPQIVHEILAEDEVSVKTAPVTEPDAL